MYLPVLFATFSYDMESFSKWSLLAVDIHHPTWHTFSGPAVAHSLTSHHLGVLCVLQWMELDYALYPALPTCPPGWVHIQDNETVHQVLHWHYLCTMLL